MIAGEEIEFGPVVVYLSRIVTGTAQPDCSTKRRNCKIVVERGRSTPFPTAAAAAPRQIRIPHPVVQKSGAYDEGRTNPSARREAKVEQHDAGGEGQDDGQRSRKDLG